MQLFFWFSFYSQRPWSLNGLDFGEGGGLLTVAFHDSHVENTFEDGFSRAGNIPDTFLEKGIVRIRLDRPLFRIHFRYQYQFLSQKSTLITPSCPHKHTHKISKARDRVVTNMLIWDLKVYINPTCPSQVSARIRKVNQAITVIITRTCHPRIYQSNTTYSVYTTADPASSGPHPQRSDP